MDVYPSIPYNTTCHYPTISSSDQYRQAVVSHAPSLASSLTNIYLRSVSQDFKNRISNILRTALDTPMKRSDVNPSHSTDQSETKEGKEVSGILSRELVLHLQSSEHTCLPVLPFYQAPRCQTIFPNHTSSSTELPLEDDAVSGAFLRLILQKLQSRQNSSKKLQPLKKQPRRLPPNSSSSRKKQKVVSSKLIHEKQFDDVDPSKNATCSSTSPRLHYIYPPELLSSPSPCRQKASTPCSASINSEASEKTPLSLSED